ncbi:unnamed protein product [Calypogeia fissa]
MSRRRRPYRGYINRLRIFRPAYYGLQDWNVPWKIVKDDHELEISYIEMEGKTPKLAIFVKGRCRGNGTPDAKAAIGIHHGPNSRDNYWECLPTEERQTNQLAELWAVIKAVEQIRDYLKRIAHNFDGVVLLTSSDYVFCGMTRNIYKWEKNGFLKVDGGPVANEEAFRELQSLIQEMEESGIGIQFWQVPKKDNQDTNRLANKALNPRVHRRSL